MSWQYPLLLWLIVPLIALLILRLWWGHALRHQQASSGRVSPQLLARIPRKRQQLRLILLWLGLLLALVSAAGPRWGINENTIESRGADLYIAIDCSRSMLARDSHPNRLEAAKRKALSLMDSAPEHRVALLPFAGTAQLLMPLSGDRSAVAELLHECTTDLFPAEYGMQGTAIGATIEEALELIGQTGSAGAAIILFSDGADSDTESVEQATEKSANNGVPIYSVFFGDPDRDVTVNIDGTDVIMKADRSTLDAIPDATGGISVNATTGTQDVQAIAQHIEGHLELQPWEEQRREVASQRYQVFLTPAFVCFLLAWLLPTIRRRNS